jgi:hypothetical protein
MNTQETLSMAIAMGRCGVCGRSVWLPSGLMFTPGREPVIGGNSTVSFRCCGRSQSIPANKVYFETVNITVVPT